MRASERFRSVGKLRFVQPTHRLDVGAVHLAAETFGNPDGVAIVLVMGATASMLWWPDEMCDALAQAGYYVIRYDHRDTGQSTTGVPGEVDYSAEDLTDDLLGVMDALDVDAAHLVGMSLGGYISQIAALVAPDRVRSLTLIASEPLGSTDELPGIDERFMDHFGAMGDLDWSNDDAVEEFLVGIGRLSAGTPERFDEAGTRRRVRSEIEASSEHRQRVQPCDGRNERSLGACSRSDHTADARDPWRERPDHSSPQRRSDREPHRGSTAPYPRRSGP